MILQELTTLYKRLLDNPDIDVCEPGFSRENISFKIVIDQEGRFKYLEDLRVMEGSNARPAKIMVPKFDGKRARGIKSYFLWDKSDYTVGLKKDEKAEVLSVLNMPEHHVAFLELIDSVTNATDLEHPAVSAIKKFLPVNNSVLLHRLTKREQLCQIYLVMYRIFIRDVSRDGDIDR